MMKFAILLILLLGAGWSLLHPESYKIVAGVALILLGAAVILRGQHG